MLIHALHWDASRANDQHPQNFPRCTRFFEILISCMTSSSNHYSVNVRLLRLSTSVKLFASVLYMFSILHHDVMRSIVHRPHLCDNFIQAKRYIHCNTESTTAVQNSQCEIPKSRPDSIVARLGGHIRRTGRRGRRKGRDAPVVAILIIGQQVCVLKITLRICTACTPEEPRSSA